MESDREVITDYIVDMWARYLLRVEMSKKLAFIYVANDLIQKSLIKAKKESDVSFNNFH